MTDRCAAAFHVFQARDYLEEWSGTMGRARGAKLCFVRVADNEEPLMLIPLALERRRGVRIVCFPDGGVADYNAPVLFPRAAALRLADMSAIWRRISGALPPFDAALLEKLPGAVDGAPNPFRLLAQEAYEESAHAVELSGDWPSFVATRLHRPKDSRRKRRRLAELGSLRFLVAANADDRERLLEALIRQKTRRYLQTRGIDGFNRPGYRTYFHALTRRFGETGEVHISGLELNGEPIAVHWGLVTADRFYCLMLAHAEGVWAQYSPGRILVEDLIAWCYAQGLSVFDLGVGDAPWKQRLGETRTPLWRAHLAHSFAGKAYIEAARLKRALRAASRQIDREPPNLEGRRVA
ncbi:MAG TPA: GNAT family N-acetyltransferase [Caulobacterales bacterium]|nr:GNAT family N-acetyltransferase [Caulobacterales bacterium]